MKDKERILKPEREKETVTYKAVPIRLSADFSKEILQAEVVSKIGGSGVHFPLAPVKRLADLRNRANSQWYSSTYEGQRPKIVEHIENSEGKKWA